MCRINRVRLWVHDALIVPCGLRRWPRWMRLVYWTYFLACGTIGRGLSRFARQSMWPKSLRSQRRDEGRGSGVAAALLNERPVTTPRPKGRDTQRRL